MVFFYKYGNKFINCDAIYDFIIILLNYKNKGKKNKVII